METIRNFIDGQFSEPASGQYLDNYRPRDGVVYGRLPDSQVDDINRAVEAAKSAFDSWRRTSREDRAHLLNRLADGIASRSEEFVQLECQDQGKPIGLARKMDIPRAIQNFRFFAGAILHQEDSAFQSSQDTMNYTIRQPSGVAGLISPWNLPLYLLTWKIAPALATGNTVVAKPSELTPATAHLLAQVMKDVGLPPGVCNLVFGRGEVAGDALVIHPEVPLISFTGGTTTAAQISQRAAPFYKKLSFELGGKNPALIFADCDLNATVKTTLRSSFLNQGEICLCTSRLFIQRSIFSQFVELFMEEVRKIAVGDPRQDETFMGPLVSAEHRKRVAGFVERASRSGAKILIGGQIPAVAEELASGYYYQPTVIMTDNAELEIMQEEVFGPVVTVTPFDDEEEAIRLANGVRYGLAATIWTQNLARAHRVAQELQSGLVWINTWLNRDLRTPFGGMKASGLGREGGQYSLDFYTESKNICFQI